MTRPTGIAPVPRKSRRPARDAARGRYIVLAGGGYNIDLLARVWALQMDELVGAGLSDALPADWLARADQETGGRFTARLMEDSPQMIPATTATKPTPRPTASWTRPGRWSPAELTHASVWEIAIKRKLGKLVAPDNLLAQLDGQRFVQLPLSAAEAWVAGHLDPHHADPFDRAMVAQALVHGLRLVTRDSTFAAYGVDVLVA